LIAGSIFHYEFEFIHPFADGNGRLGRLWQTLILFRWNPLLAHIPVESLVHAHQADYYHALRRSTDQTDSASFVEFMLRMIRDAVTAVDAPQVTPQVERLLQVMVGAMSREELQRSLDLQDRKSFQLRYLRPALADDLIEMTIPGKPHSRLQQYRLTLKGKKLLARLLKQKK
jgi:Fic family protein